LLGETVRIDRRSDAPGASASVRRSEVRPQRHTDAAVLRFPGTIGNRAVAQLMREPQKRRLTDAAVLRLSGAIGNRAVAELMREPQKQLPAGQPLPPGVEMVELSKISYSQEDISFHYRQPSGDKRSVGMLAADMKKTGWDPHLPADVVRMPDGRLVSVDHRRLWAAQKAGITHVSARIHAADEAMGAENARRFEIDAERVPAGTNPSSNKPWRRGDRPSTWGDAVRFRSAVQEFSKTQQLRNRGPNPRSLPAGGTRDPKFPAEGSPNQPSRTAPGVRLEPVPDTAGGPEGGGTKPTGGGRVPRNVGTGVPDNNAPAGTPRPRPRPSVTVDDPGSPSVGRRAAAAAATAAETAIKALPFITALYSLHQGLETVNNFEARMQQLHSAGPGLKAAGMDGLPSDADLRNKLGLDDLAATDADDVQWLKTNGNRVLAAAGKSREKPAEWERLNNALDHIQARADAVNELNAQEEAYCDELSKVALEAKGRSEALATFIHKIDELEKTYDRLPDLEVELVSIEQTALSVSGQLSVLETVLTKAAKVYFDARWKAREEWIHLALTFDDFASERKALLQARGYDASGKRDEYVIWEKPNNSDLWGPDWPRRYAELTAIRK
jgi:hypothetical protein